MATAQEVTLEARSGNIKGLVKSKTIAIPLLLIEKTTISILQHLAPDTPLLFWVIVCLPGFVEDKFHCCLYVEKPIEDALIPYPQGAFGSGHDVKGLPRSWCFPAARENTTKRIRFLYLFRHGCF
jgi:hypothetical protein